MGILSILIWLPILGGLLVLAVGRMSAGKPSGNGVAGLRPDRLLALAVSLLCFALSLPLWTDFNAATADMQFVERMPWIRAFNVEYYLGVDGFSMPLILLTDLID